MTPEIEISQAALNSLSNCLLVDIRDAESVAYGMIPGAVALPQERLEAEVPARCAGRPVVLYCARGPSKPSPTRGKWHGDSRDG